MRRGTILGVLCCGAALVLADEKSFKGKIYASPSSLPRQKAFFPLTDGDGTELATWPSSPFNGTCESATGKEDWWVADEVFGSVLRCSRETSDYIKLTPVNYADDGNFTVAFWVKPATEDMSGDLFQYLYSHTAYGLGNEEDAFAPNSLNFYLPEQQHPAYGLIRTVVKDENDPDVTSFLDSDGVYNNNQQRVGNSKNLTDGQWHLVTVSSRLDGQKGYLVYIDGALSAQLPLPSYIPGDESVLVDGGDPMKLVGDIVLCSRDNVTSGRHFSGSIAHLSLYDQALTSEQLSELYQTVAPNTESSSSDSETMLGSSEWLNQFSNSSFLQTNENDDVMMCLSNDTEAGCATGYTCISLSPSQINSLGSAYTNLPVGVCARPDGNSLPTSSLPTPAAYFPLSNYSDYSWPVPDKWAWNTTTAGSVDWVEDDTFGPVVECNASKESSLSIGSFAWGTSGSFAINMWMQQYESSGSVFQYLFSTRAIEDGPISNSSTDVYQPNEVHIYLPEQGHPAHDLVRAIVKDSDDNYTSTADENFMDSDGQIGSNLPRDTPRLNLTDGNWHMVTVTTQPSGERGFSIYVDGLLMATMQDGQNFFSVSGGDRISVSGNIVLCGRCDLGLQRFFSGRIAQLGVFNNALTADVVLGLYYQVYQSPPVESLVASTAHTQPVTGAPTGLFESDGGDSTGIGLQFLPGLDNGNGASWDSSLAGSTSSTGSSARKSGGLSGGAIAGIVLGVLAGVLVLTALIALILSSRRRRMTGVSRLQEVPMPALNSTSPPEGRYIEDQYVVTLNKKVLEAEQQRATRV